MQKCKMFLVLLLCIFIVGCGGKKDSATDGKMTVVASIYPMAEFTRIVGGDKINLITVVPSGVEAHDYELTAGNMKDISSAELFIYNGGGMEPWADKLRDNLKGKNVKMLNAGEGLFESKSDSKLDPHIWLDPKMATQQVHAISKALQGLDPKNKKYYQDNAATFVIQLAKLDEEYREMRETARKTQFVTTHAAFGWLAKRYKLEQIAIRGLTPSAEPTPATMTQLIGIVRTQNLQYIFFEELVDPKIAQTIAKETGMKTLILNPLEGLSRAQEGKNPGYLVLMRQNLANLKLALESE